MALLETLIDTFGGSSIDGALWDDGSVTAPWDGSYSASVTLVEGSGDLSITPASGSGYNSVTSHTTYNFTGSFAYGRVDQVCNTGDSHEDTEFHVGITSTSRMRFVQEAGTLYLQKADGGGTNVGSVTYNATTHKWWRLREASGTIYGDTSSDGTSWNNLGSTTVTWAYTAVYAQLCAGAYSSTTSPTAAKYAMFNTTGAVQDTPELRGRPEGLRGQNQMQQLLAV